MFSEKDFEAHTCDMPIKGNRLIEVADILDVSYDNKKIITVQGLNGALYTFEVVPRKPISIMIPLQQTKSNRFHGDEETDGEVPVPFSTIYKRRNKNICVNDYTDHLYALLSPFLSSISLNFF